MTWSAETEEARIRSAYALRRADDHRYSWFNAGHVFLAQERERQLLALLGRHGWSQLADKTILEIGCGTGHWLREFVKWGARPEHVTGVELLGDRVAEARRLSPARVTVECRSAVQLPAADASVDIVFQSTVFSSILCAEVRDAVAAEMMRVVKPDGIILWYDFFVNNPRNPHVRGVRKAEIRRLFPQSRITLHRVSLAPPVVRFLARYSWLACHLLGAIPWLCTHHLGVIRPHSPSRGAASCASSDLNIARAEHPVASFGSQQ